MPFLYVLIGLAAVVLIIFILFSINLSFIIDYSDKTVVTLKYLFLKIPLVDTSKPKKEKKKKEKKPKQQSQNPRQVGADAPPPEPKSDKKEQGGSILDFLPLVKTLFDFLGDFRRKLRLDNLQLKLIMAGGDPYNLAMNYGKAWAAVGNLLPKLEQWFVIRKRDVEVECDFVATKTTVIAHLDLTITLGRLLAAVFKFLIKALIKFLQIQKKRKGGAVNEPDVT